MPLYFDDCIQSLNRKSYINVVSLSAENPNYTEGTENHRVAQSFSFATSVILCVLCVPGFVNSTDIDSRFNPIFIIHTLSFDH